jgi:DNA-binding MarR family transcriptional regulator
MPPVAADQDQPGLALNEVFGSKGQVRLLRILATENQGFKASPEVAARAGLTPSGARKALRRLVAAGLVEKVGTGRATRYVLNEESALAGEIVRLFESERKVAEPGWAREHSRAETTRRKRGRTRSGNGGEPASGKGNGEAMADPSPMMSPQVKVDPGDPEFHNALASLLEEELSLLRRARQNVLEKLKNRHPGNGHDLWEWRKILDTFPLPRLLHFMESSSPLAVRLRKSSPFVEVMSEQEKARLGELMEKVH